MTIPILIDGREQGALETRREGAYTLFEARCAYLPGVRRLWVFGEEGERACLGVMQPERGELRLRRKLSRAALRGFPREIVCAGLAERGKTAPPRERSAPPPAAPPRGDGAFILTEKGGRYLALPCALRRVPPGARLREIGARSYLLFRC